MSAASQNPDSAIIPESCPACGGLEPRLCPQHLDAAQPPELPQDEPAPPRMSQDAAAEYFDAVRPRYRKAKTRKERAFLLDEMSTVSGRARKHIIKVMARSGPRESRPRPGRPLKYSQEAMDAVIWFRKHAGHLNARALHAEMPYLIADAEEEKLLVLADAVKDEAIEMSPATIGRRIQKDRELSPRDYPPRVRYRPPPSTLQAMIPIRISSEWDGEPPGTIQADLVHHSGTSGRGKFLYTLMMVDISTHWVFMVALEGKEQNHVLEGLKLGREEFPFRMRSLHSDNGSEFVNETINKWRLEHGIIWTRGRPGHSNDQAVAEERNSTGVRRVTGRDRYVGVDALAVLDELLAARALFMNFFEPTTRRVAKTVVTRKGVRVRNRPDEPDTPYRRVLRAGVLDAEAARRLKETYEENSRFELLRKIEELQDRLFELRAPGVGV